MSELPFLTVGNYYFVPVLRQRLMFAVLMRKALNRLEPWDDRDLLCVALPSSIEAQVRAAVSHKSGSIMPVAMVISTWREGEPHEVFPVTPADAMIEAVRVAVERKLPLSFIDRELVAGHLRLRSCLRDSDWPDDEVILRQGAATYLELVAPLLEQPPIRFDPVDCWREEYIAERLRVLGQRFRRVLVVCEAVHVRPVMAQLQRPSRRLTLADAGPPPKSVRSIRPKLAYQLRALDDFPRLVEHYELFRQGHDPAEFQKWSALLRCIETSLGNVTSTRSMISFYLYLQSLLLQKARLSPRSPELQAALEGCFGRNASIRIMMFLAGYGQEIEVERVLERVSDKQLTYVMQIETTPPEAEYIARFCNPESPVYEVLPPPPTPPPPAGAEGSRQGLVVHPSREYMESMRKKVAAIASFQRRKARVTPFSGSLQRGIDLRRTLRSFLSPQPSIFVREFSRTSSKLDYVHEPIVWLLRPVPKQPSVEFGYSRTFSKDADPRYTMWLHCDNDPQTVFESNDKLFEFQDSQVFGLISYFDAPSFKTLKEALGASFVKRVPDAKSSSVCRNCGIDLSLHAMAASDTAWWDVLMMLGLVYCDKMMICVVPDGFRIADRVLAAAHRLKKEIVSIHLSSLSRHDTSLLETKRYVSFPTGMNEDQPFWERVQGALAKLGVKTGALLTERVTPSR